MKFITIFIFFCFFLGSKSLFSQDINTILNNHYVAIGQDTRTKIRSLLLEVKEENQNNEEKKYSIIKKKPNKIRIEGVWQGQNYISAFDGIRAWTIAPWTGVSIPQLMTFIETDDIKSKDGIDSPLYVSQQKGDEIVYSGKVLIDDVSFHLLKINSIENPSMEYYLYTDSYLIFKSLRYDREENPKVIEEVIYQDYELQEIPGVGEFQQSMRLEVMDENEKVDLIIEEIIIGFGAPNSFFTKPN